MLAQTQLPLAALAEGDDVTGAAAAAAEPLAVPTSFSSVMLRTLSDCQLAVSIYPTFSYNASGGGGTGRVTRVQEDGVLEVEFDPSRSAGRASSWAPWRLLPISLLPPSLAALTSLPSTQPTPLSWEFRCRHRCALPLCRSGS